MSEKFDPYLKWLGIRNAQRPVNHYRILGLEPFESDPEVIESAASRQLNHIADFRKSDFPDACELLLLELDAARRCLLNAKTKAAYDLRLRETVETDSESPRGSTLPAENTPSKGTANKRSTPELEFELSKIEAYERENAPIEDRIEIDLGHSSRTEVKRIGRSQQPPVPKTPVQRPTRPRRKKNPVMADLFGWLLGGVGAVLFAVVLLNTDILNRLRGKAAEPDPMPESQFVLKEEGPAGRSATTGENRTGSPPTLEVGEQSVSTDASDRSAPEAPVLDQRDNGKPIASPDVAPRSKPKLPIRRSEQTGKRIVPDAESVRSARSKFKEEFRSQFKAKNSNARRLLAQSLTTRAKTAAVPAEEFALLQLAGETAADLGDLNQVLISANAINNSFEVRFWEILGPLAQQAISNANDQWQTQNGLRRVLELATEQQQFQLASDLADSGARNARKIGDRLQQQLLSSYSRDMKALALVQKRIEELAVPNDAIQRGPDALELSPKQKSGVGKFLCYCQSDWESGLPFLAAGNDRLIARTAAADLQAAGSHETLVVQAAESWISLRSKSKYKSPDRRFFALRAIELLKSVDASVTAANSGVRDRLERMKSETQISKQYLGDTNGLMGRTVIFEIVPPANFDAAQLENGQVLVLRLGQQLRRLPVHPVGAAAVELESITNDRRTRFLIRPLQYGVVEMRLVDAANGTLINVLYGK